MELLDTQETLAYSLILSMLLLLFPIIQWLRGGWVIRREEFKNQIEDGALRLYIEKFWKSRIPASGTISHEDLKKIFDQIYNQQFGRIRYIPSLLILTFTACLELGLAEQSAIHRTNHANLLPIAGIQLPDIGIAAIAGAYLFVIADAVKKGYQRALSIADVYWYALRMVIALPMGYALSTIANPSVGPFIAFALGVFPLEAITKLFRRIMSRTVGVDEQSQQADELVQLGGITVPIAATLAVEGIESIQVLASKDPVLLSCRTALPFDFILELAAQALSQSYLGSDFRKLVPLGLGDAYLISQFMKQNPPSQPQTQISSEEIILAEAAKLLGPIPYEAAYQAFKTIHEDNYTQFLEAVWK